jgi:glycosyltransferase involved in cell wall biosynthesis
MKVALLTGGKDAPYVLGLLRELVATGVQVVLVGGDEVAEAANERLVEFHNLVGAQDPRDGPLAKAWRVVRYYMRLLVFAARSDAKLLHVLWFRKFPHVERILFTGYFKLLGKKVAFTAHNVDDQARDAKRGTLAQKVSLQFLYRTVDHIFVHTDQAKSELVERFHVSPHKVTVVPFGINDITPVSTATRLEARQRLGLRPDQRVLLFFGHVAPYKGLEELVRALALLIREDPRFTAIVAGQPKDRNCERHWGHIESLIAQFDLASHVRAEIRRIADDEVGLLFRAADVCMLPYRQIYQSGVLALSYAQGVPVIASDVGSFRDDVVEDETGWIFRSGDIADLAAKTTAYFASDLFNQLEVRRPAIRRYGAEHFSWKRHAERTLLAYESLLRD